MPWTSWLLLGIAVASVIALCTFAAVYSRRRLNPGTKRSDAGDNLGGFGLGLGFLRRSSQRPNTMEDLVYNSNVPRQLWPAPSRSKPQSNQNQNNFDRSDSFLMEEFPYTSPKSSASPRRMPSGPPKPLSMPTPMSMPMPSNGANSFATAGTVTSTMNNVTSEVNGNGAVFSGARSRWGRLNLFPWRRRGFGRLDDDE